jgi:ABC-type uncharacterized transport system ATPase subunit
MKVLLAPAGFAVDILPRLSAMPPYLRSDSVTCRPECRRSASVRSTRVISLTSSSDHHIINMAELLLEVRDLSCIKGKEDPIFSGLSFDLHAGDVLVLSGRSGAGFIAFEACPTPVR